MPLLLGIFLIGISSANVSQAQTNAYWDVNGTTNGQGGSATFSQSGSLWTTSNVNATANSGGPSGGGLFSITSGAGAGQSGNYILNFGGTAGNVKQGGNYEAVGINFLTTGYGWFLDGAGANSRTITTSNGVNIYGNVLTISNGTTGTNSFTFAAAPGPAVFTSNMTSTNFVIQGTGGGGLTLKNYSTSATNPFSVFVNSAQTKSTNAGVISTNAVVASISSNAPITVDIGAGSKIMLGTSTSQGGVIDANIINSSASGAALNLVSSTTGTAAFNGVISGANGLVLDNASGGKIALNGANTYAGGTTVNSTASGTINLGTSTALGTGTVTISNGSTAYLRSSANALDFANAVNIGTGATLQLAAVNSGHKTTWSGEIGGAGGINYAFKDEGLYLTGTNSSFGGGVNLGSSGTLYVKNLGMAGFNSSIGTNRAITISTTGNTGGSTVRWNGSANETSDKNFVLTTTSTNASAGISIYAEGASTNTLTLNGNINSTGINNKAITLAGYSNNTLILNGTINETLNYTNRVIIGVSQSGTVVLANTNNSFSGGVTITNSTGSTTTVLSVANIGMSGVNSALGKNGTINIGGTSASALTTLKYTGTGETSDKVINLSAAVGGAILDQSGTTGNLKFTQAITATGVGAKSITLKGATAATGELGGNIADGAGSVISLVKNGSGTWILSGSNSYTGSTTVEAKETGGSFLKLMSTRALSTKTSLLGSSSLTNIGTVNFGAVGDYTADSFGNSGTQGNNMAFTNSSGGVVNLTFTNGNNVLTATAGSSGGKTLLNQSANLNIVFDGNMDIGSTNYATGTGINHEIGGSGNWLFKGNLTNGAGIRGLDKIGTGTLELRGTSNSFTGTTKVNEGTLNLSGGLTGSTDLTVSTTNTVSSSSATRTAAATLNVASGSSLLGGSTTTVYSGGNLIVNGTAGTVVVETNGLVGGSGTVGAFTLKSGGFLTPGNSPGTLTALSATWEAGSTYNWEINSNASSAAAGTNWDLFSVTGTLDMSALSSATTMNLVLASLSGFDLTSSINRTWVIAQAGSLLGTGGAALSTGADVSDYFNINATAFNAGSPSLVTGWKIEVGETTVSGSTLQTLQLMTIPEPSTGSLLAFGLSGLVLTRLLRRKQS